MSVCDTLASRSKCLSRRIGSVIVKDNSFIVSTGYNGPPVGYPHCECTAPNDEWLHVFFDDNGCINHSGVICPRHAKGFVSGDGLHICPSSHAERNAIAIAAKLGHSTEGCTIYVNFMMCAECAKSVVNAGIREVVVPEIFRYEKYDGLSAVDIFNKTKTTIRRVDG